MALPISFPFRREAAPHHRAGNVARSRRAAKGGGAFATRGARRPAAQRRSGDDDMARRPHPATRAEQRSEMIACHHRVSGGAGVSRTATAVHLAGSDARTPDVRAFGAPDRSVAVPDRDRGAGEGLSGRNHRRGKQEGKDHRGLIPSGQGSSIPNLGGLCDGV